MEKQILILQSLCEGNSIRSIERITDTNRDTIVRLLVSAGNKALIEIFLSYSEYFCVS